MVFCRSQGHKIVVGRVALSSSVLQWISKSEQGLEKKGKWEEREREREGEKKIRLKDIFFQAEAM